MRLIIACTAALCLTGCAETAQGPGGSSTSTSSVTPLVNVNEPGDTALGCPQLSAQILKLNTDLQATQKEIADGRAAQAGLAASSSAMASSGIPGGGMLSVLQGINTGASMGAADNVAALQDRSMRLEMRRDNLTGLYNMKCAMAQASAKKR